MRKKIAYLIKHYAFVQLLYRNIMSLLFKIWGCFIQVDDKLVLLSSMSGDQYAGSPKVLFEAMKTDPRFEGYYYIWAFSNPASHDIDGIGKVKIDTFKYFKIALQAKIWITDVNIERGLHFKKNNQIYLNTWHGTGPKKGGNAVSGRKDYDFSYVDIVCVDGKYARDEMVNYFNAKDENLLWCGRPREDELFALNDNDRIIIRNQLNIPNDKKIILYMPTWREYGLKSLDEKIWEEKLSKDYVVLVRAHHFTTEKIVNEKKMWIDVTEYSNVNNLYFIADILISDYSSAFFDFGLLGKPMICFAYDYSKYEKSNGLLINLKDEFPNGIKQTDEEVIDMVLGMNFEEESAKCKAFCDRYVKHPGNATKECIDRLDDLMHTRRKQ